MSKDASQQEDLIVSHAYHPAFHSEPLHPTLLTHSPFNVITDFVKGRRTHRPMMVVILIKPRAQHTPSTFDPSNLHPFTPPPLLSVVHAENSPPDLALR